jgi:cytochrome c biogenesis protein CcdA
VNGLVVAAGAALWLGILTSISPCPLATNIAAISFISRKVGRPGYVLSTGLLYTIGRTITYVLLAIVLVKGLSSMPVVSHWLQKYMNRLLGPVLILVAMVLLDLLSFNVSSGSIASWCNKRAAGLGLAGALLIGILFALTFCSLRRLCRYQSSTHPPSCCRLFTARAPRFRFSYSLR